MQPQPLQEHYLLARQPFCGVKLPLLWFGMAWGAQRATIFEVSFGQE